MRRVIVAVHWSDAGDPHDIDAACAAMQPLKAADTSGWAGAYSETDGADLLAILRDREDPDLAPVAEGKT